MSELRPWLLFVAIVAGCDKPVEAVDTDTDVDTDSDTDTDTDPDTDTDTDSDTDSDTDTDTDTAGTNLLANPGFESSWSDWLIYPADLSNYAIIATGDTIFDSTDTFTAYAGSKSLKVWGRYTGGPNETPIYQEFPATAGETYTLSGVAWMHKDDPLSAAHTSAYLSIKYFDDSYNYYGSSDSEKITKDSAQGTWIPLTVTGTVPTGATKVQAAIELWQCVGDTSGACYDGYGAVYFDDVVFE